MKQNEIVPFDLERMLWGEAPPEFLVEVFLRGLVLYLFMLFIMRWLGKRMAGELSVTEMVLMVTLGASVAVAMQSPDGGVLKGFVVLTCALIFERGVGWLTIHSLAFERLTQGEVSILIKDGVLQLDKMNGNRVTREQLFSILRTEQITNLGKVERLYLEAGGNFSLYKTSGDAQPGLPVLPLDDKDIIEQQQTEKDKKACICCGFVAGSQEEQSCANCGASNWVSAIL